MGIDTSNLPPIPDGFQIKDASASATPSGQSGLPPIPDGFQLKGGGNQTDGISGKDIAEHPLVSLGKTLMRPAAENLTGKSLEDMQRQRDLSSAANTDFKGMNAYQIQNKLGDVQDSSFKNAVVAQVGDALSTPANYVGQAIVKGVDIPAVKAVAKAIPEGLKQSSYALMQSIVNQLPKEFKYGANAGRAMVKEGLQGDASDIKEQSAAKIKEIGAEGDKLASTSNKPINNQNAIKIIDDKISELQKNAPRENASTITRLQNAKRDLLGAVEDKDGNVISQSENPANMNPKQTLDFKRKYDYLTQWKGTTSDDSIVNSTLQASRRAIKDNLNDAVPGIKEWNQRYADLSAANQAAARRVTYDQAGTGMANILNHFVRGSVGMSTVGAMLTGHGELAGEILAGWGAKEVLGNPMVKSKVAQMLYGLSESDKSDIFKIVPWAKRAIFGQKPNVDQVDAELMPKGVGYTPPSNPKLLNNDYAPRRGPNAEVSMGGLPNPNTTPIRQSGQVPKGLPEPFQGRSGVDRPWENNALPSPKDVKRGTGPIIYQQGDGVASHLPKRNMERIYPKTDFGTQLKYQMQRKENVPLHPAEAGREELANIYPPAEKGNPNLKPGDIKDFNDMKDWELSQNPGGWKSHGPQMDLTFTKSQTDHSQAFQKVSNNSEKVGFDLLRRASNGEEMSNGDKLKIQMMLHDFRKNIKPKMG